MGVDSRTPMQKSIDKAKGALAEQLFIDLHTRIGCLVYRTGTEFLYPHLYTISRNMKEAYLATKLDESMNDIHRDRAMIMHAQAKKLLAEKTGQAEESIDDDALHSDIQDWLNQTDRKLDSRLYNQHSYHRDTEHEVYSAPDFTVISPSGAVTQFEVKYSPDGVLKKEKIDRIFKYHPKTVIFVFMDEEPYINLYLPVTQKVTVYGEDGLHSATLAAKMLSSGLTKEEQQELDALAQKQAATPATTESFYWTTMDSDKDHIAQGRAQGFTDDQILISFTIPDAPEQFEAATMFKFEYPLSLLAEYALIARTAITPLKKLWREQH